jgi:cell division protein FtsB
MRRAFLPAVAFLVLVGVLFVAVFPTRTWLAQRQSISAEEKRLRVLTEQNQALAARVQELETDAEIERLAREQYNLVRPGEEAYAILPAPGAQPPDDSWPGQPDQGGRGWWDRVWEALRSAV